MLIRSKNPNSFDKYDSIHTSFRVDERTLNNRFIISDISDKPARNIVILLNKPKQINNKKYLDIIGIDVFTGKVVKVVDTNGAELGLHTYNLSISNLKEQDVIQAMFKPYKNNKFLNLLRITSEYTALGKSNVSKLRNKYKALFWVHNNYTISDFVTNFNTVFKFLDYNRNTMFYALTRFAGTKLLPHLRKNGDKKYQLKMGKSFVDVLDKSISISKKKGLYYQGWAIISTFKDKSGKIFITAHRLLGKFYSEEEYKSIKAEKLIDIEHEEYELTEWDDQDVDCFLEEGEESFDAFEECDDSYYEEWYDEYCNDYQFVNEMEEKY
jgi:hypothetical protein